MNRKLKALGVALMAVFAMAAIGAQAASAADFSSESSSTTLTATGTNHQLSVTGSTVNCSTVSFTGQVEGETANEATVSPVYTGCTAFSFINSKITGFGHYGEENTCDYVLHANGTADLECEEGASVVIDAGTCSATIPEQTGLGTVGYKNVSNGDVEVDIDISEITLDHKDGFACPFSGNGTDQKIGLLTGTSVVEGENGGEAVNIAWNE